MIYCRVFTCFPLSKQYFGNFQNMKHVEEIQASSLLKKHILRVMTGLDTLMTNVQDVEKLVSMISLMAKSYALGHNLKAAYFKVSRGVCSKYNNNNNNLHCAAKTQSVPGVKQPNAEWTTHKQLHIFSKVFHLFLFIYVLITFFIVLVLFDMWFCSCIYNHHSVINFSSVSYNMLSYIISHASLSLFLSLFFSFLLSEWAINHRPCVSLQCRFLGSH